MTHPADSTVIAVFDLRFEAKMDNDIFQQMARPALLGLGAVLALVIFLIIFAKLSKGKKETLAKPGRLDLLELKKQGLLSPEEIEKVSQSMLRQMERQDQKNRRITTAPTSDSLLLDPEVRRLEALAGAAKTDKERHMESNKHPTHQFGPDNTPITSPHLETTISTEDLSQVELPLDVQQLADSGLLSDEEILNVKRRLLERRRAR